MKNERPCHCDIRRHHHPHQECWIEDVAVHCRHERHSAKEIRIPLREATGCRENAGAELPEGVSGDELIAVLPCEEFPRKCWIPEGHRTESVEHCSQQALPRRCGSL